MASSLLLSPLSFSTSESHHTLSRSTTLHRNTIIVQFNLRRPPPSRLQASKRVSNFTQESSSSVDDPRNWSRNRSGVVVGEYEDDDEDDDEEDEEDRSLDLLVRFVQNVFKKISRKARKAVRSVLPINISTKLVGFSVDGVVILAFLWVLKAFLEVICTLGSVVFVSILLIRGIWAGITYLQEMQNRRTYDLDDDPPAWSSVQPVT